MILEIDDRHTMEERIVNLSILADQNKITIRVLKLDADDFDKLVIDTNSLVMHDVFLLHTPLGKITILKRSE